MYNVFKRIITHKIIHPYNGINTSFCVEHIFARVCLCASFLSHLKNYFLFQNSREQDPTKPNQGNRFVQVPDLINGKRE